MKPVAFVPVLPESAPFTPEQRAYLNGFLAGLFSHAPVPAAATAPAPKPLTPLTVLFGSQTGTAEKLAKRIAKEAGQRGFAPTVHDLAKYPPAQLAAEPAVLLVTSTYGDGEPPDNARAFWEALRMDAAPRLDRVRFSLCALGDSNYPRFCQFGRDLDARLEALGARRVTPRQDCDVEFDQPFAAWLAAALGALRAEEDGGLKIEDGNAAPSTMHHAPCASVSVEAGWSKSRPCPARLKANRRLSGPGSAKDVRHIEIVPGDSGLLYEAGDALGVWPTNCPELVAAVLAAGGWDGEEAVPGRDGAETSLRLALLRDCELGRIPPPLLAHFAAASGDAALREVTAPDANGARQQFLHGRDVLDLLLGHPGVRLKPAEFTGLLRKLQPRLYSISSSPKAHPGEVHLTVSAVRYEAGGRARKGVASCFLADRCAADTPVPVFVHANPAFRPPAGDVPLIMIGPGTGIAPFRAFLEERAATGATGRNWLFFGDQTAAQDYLYRDEIEGFVRAGLLTRLDLAWSRDQAEKIYVQHRMLAAADELWRWLEEGAAVYVCGDASRMARDVDAALHQVIMCAGGRSSDAAREYVKAMQATRRYQRDVY